MLGSRNSGSDLPWRAALCNCCIFRCWQILKAYPEPHELLMEIAVPKALMVTRQKNTGVIQLTAAAEVMVIHPGDVPLPSEQHMYEGTTRAKIPSIVSPHHRTVSSQMGPALNTACVGLVCVPQVCWEREFPSPDC